MIDTHAHIDTDAFDHDRQSMLARAWESGVENIIIPGIEPAGFEKIIKLAEPEEKIYFGIGIHPHNALQAGEDQFAQIQSYKTQAKLVAIGEIGLDYYYDFAPKETQRIVFREQLKIAKAMNLPVIVHNRESDEDLMNIITEEQDGNLTGVMHCFSGDSSLLQSALDQGFHISFTGNITFKKTNLENIVRETPIDKLLLETDSPYMTPVPNRGKRNEPAYIRFIAEKIAEIKMISINEVIQMTTNNAKKLFRIAAIVPFIIIALLIFSGTSIGLLAQDEEAKDTEYVENPYHKGLGFGFDIGTNTIVETQYYQNLKKSISYEGIFFWGATINYAMLEYLYLEATYAYSKNTKVINKSMNLEGPHINQIWELTSQWLVNPRSKISFYGLGGLSLFHSTLNKGRIFETSSSAIGFNFGIGFRFNQQISNIGLLNIIGEWRLNWAPTRVAGKTFWDSDNIPDNIESISFSSMPRLVILFYPDIFKNLSLD